MKKQILSFTALLLALLLAGCAASAPDAEAEAEAALPLCGADRSEAHV